MQNFDVFCIHCPQVELEVVLHGCTFIYICPECPNVTFEYVIEQDILNVAEYLNRKKGTA